MRIATPTALTFLGLLGLTTLTGCMSIHASVPEELVRQHMAREHDVEIAALCSHRGERYSEGAVTCMEGQRMTCDAAGHWAAGEGC